MKNRISIGISSIVLIFMILCLSVFSLLSLSDARTALSFAERHADAVRIYYEADANGQQFIRDFRQAVADGQDAQTAMDTAAGQLFTIRQTGITESGSVLCDISLANGQTLRVELSDDGSDILSYYIYNDQEYDLDTHLPVFGGADGF